VTTSVCGRVASWRKRPETFPVLRIKSWREAAFRVLKIAVEGIDSGEEEIQETNVGTGNEKVFLPDLNRVAEKSKKTSGGGGNFHWGAKGRKKSLSTEHRSQKKSNRGGKRPMLAGLSPKPANADEGRIKWEEGGGGLPKAAIRPRLEGKQGQMTGWRAGKVQGICGGQGERAIHFLGKKGDILASQKSVVVGTKSLAKRLPPED